MSRRRSVCPYTGMARCISQCHDCVDGMGVPHQRGIPKCGLHPKYGCVSRNAKAVIANSVPLDSQTDLVDYGPTPCELLEIDLLRTRIYHVLKTLTQAEQFILDQRFGLSDGHSRTLEEVGSQLNTTRERIRQIEARALRKLRHPVRLSRLPRPEELLCVMSRPVTERDNRDTP